jgi:galactose-1-phosphate uridylyltransferase
MFNSINKSDITKNVEVYYLAANPVREVTINLASAEHDLNQIKSQEAKPSPAPSCTIL